MQFADVACALKTQTAIVQQRRKSNSTNTNKNRAAGNVRTCGAVYLLEEIVLVNNNWLNPVWIIEIVYFIQRKKSTQVGKITNYNKKNTLKFSTSRCSELELLSRFELETSSLPRMRSTN